MNKPVAWMDSLGNLTKQNLGDFIPLYTHPAELTDEDLEIITEVLLMVGFMDEFVNYDLKEKALAILRKAQEK